MNALQPFVPHTELGHTVWLVVGDTWRGEVCTATIYDNTQLAGDEPTARTIDPRSAARLLTSVEGFESDELSHISVRATVCMHQNAAPRRERKKKAPLPSFLPDYEEPSGAAARKGGARVTFDPAAKAPSGEAASEAQQVGEAPSTPQREPVPVELATDQYTLSRLDEFVGGDAFNAPVQAFAAEHCHKFKPLAAGDEYPLHYQQLYLAFEAVLDAALESFLAEHHCSVRSLLDVVARAKARGDRLDCIDVLLAASDFPTFLELMLDHKFGLYAEREITPASVMAEIEAGSALPTAKGGGLTAPCLTALSTASGSGSEGQPARETTAAATTAKAAVAPMAASPCGQHSASQASPAGDAGEPAPRGPPSSSASASVVDVST